MKNQKSIYFSILIVASGCVTASLLIDFYSGAPIRLKLFSIIFVIMGIALLALSIYVTYRLQSRGLEKLNGKQRRAIQRSYARRLLPLSAKLHPTAISYAVQQSAYVARYVWIAVALNIGLALLVIGFNLAANVYVSGQRTYWTFNNTANQIAFGLLGFRIAYNAKYNTGLQSDPSSADQIARQNKGWFERNWW